MEKQEIENYRKAGEIAKKVVAYAKSIIRAKLKLKDIAEEIENKIEELGGKPAFPVNLCVNEIAAHDTPTYNDERVAEDLLKVDIGVSISGCICDVAFSMDLKNSDENKKLILSSEKALVESLKVIKKNVSLDEIGRKIHNVIVSEGFSPIKNLSGHELKPYVVHAGITIPNYDNGNKTPLPEGVYAIEPFATSGLGIVYDSAPSGIYKIERIGGVRDNLARKILRFVLEEYKTLPFCSRWIVKKFGPRAILALNFLEKEMVISQYAKLVEKNKEKVSQTETSILVRDKVEVLA